MEPISVNIPVTTLKEAMSVIVSQAMNLAII